MTAPARVVVLGTGLIGASAALALRERGVDVLIDDADLGALDLAVEVGAGRPLRGETGDIGADVCLVAVPPRVTAATLRAAQDLGLAATYTDVASVKQRVADDALRAGCDLTSYVGGHPLAGRERSGPSAAQADLFVGRPWVLTPTADTDLTHVSRVRAVVLACGGIPVVMDAGEHDRAVALVSHLPQVAASAVAARLADAAAEAVGVAGQGVRDVTRIAASAPDLWTDILTANAAAVVPLLDALVADLAHVANGLRAVAGGDATSAAAATDLLQRGNVGRSRLPGKHGRPAVALTAVQVLVRDEPGQLATLFRDAGSAGVNVEDLSVDHVPGAPLGQVDLLVQPEAAELLVARLREQGWHAALAGAGQ